MHERIRKAVFSIAIVILAFGAVSCSIGFPERVGKIHFSFTLPQSGSERSLQARASDARVIAPGTARFLIRIEGQGLGAALGKTVDAAVSGGTATASFDAVPFGSKTITIVSQDSAGNQISSGTTTVEVVSAETSVTLPLNTLNVASTLGSTLSNIALDALAPGAVRVYRFDPPATDGWLDYSVSIMYSPCAFAVYDSEFKKIGLVGDTAEKWALVTEKHEGDSFYVIVSNSTDSSKKPQLRLERAYYGRYLNRTLITGDGSRASPRVGAVDLYNAVNASLLPVRCIMASGDPSVYPVTLREGESLYGGFNAVDWTRNRAAYPTYISYGSSAPRSLVSDAVGITQATVVDGMDVLCGAYVSSQGTSVEAMSLANGSPIITNNFIAGPTIDPRGLDNQGTSLYGILEDSGAQSPIIAFNRILGGRMEESSSSGSASSNCMFEFFGIDLNQGVTGFSLIASNEIVGWYADGISNGDIDPIGNAVHVYGLQTNPTFGFSTGSLLGNTIDTGRAVLWTATVQPQLIALWYYDPSSPGVTIDNILGSSETVAFDPNPNTSYVFYSRAPTFGVFLSNLCFRAAASFPLRYYYPALEGPSDISAANASLFPAQSGDFGNHRLTGSYVNCTVNPATGGAAGADYASAISGLSEFEKDFLLWDLAGQPRTAPTSIGCYERD